jgi:microcompartment protein CcmL/EutN
MSASAQSPTGQNPTGLILELSTIAQGYLVLDQCLKAGAVQVVEASAISPGKFLIFLKGRPEEIDKAYQAANAAAKGYILDFAVLPALQDELLQAPYGLSKVEATRDGVVVVETSGLSAMLLGLNAMLSQRPVSLIEIRAGRGIGGKSTAFFTGAAKDLAPALEAFVRTVKPRGSWINGQVIADPHPEFLSFFNISGVD